MATKKKELLEQENSAPETTVPVENTPPPDEAQADMAAPSVSYTHLDVYKRQV